MTSFRGVALYLACVGGMLGLSACTGNAASSPPLSPYLANLQRAGPISKIKHVVIVVQENRSFNNLFMGYPGATSQKYGYMHTGKKIRLEAASLDGHVGSAHFLLNYSLGDFLKQCNGTGSIRGTDCQMNGFDTVPPICGTSGCGIEYPQYTYVPLSEIKPYWDLAKQYVLADHMFASNIDESSFISHQYIIAAQAMQSYNWPNTKYWGCEGPPGDDIAILGPERNPDGYGSESVCFSDLTLGQEGDNSGVSWAFYSAPVGEGNGGGWNGYQANQYVYGGSDWTNNVIQNPAQFLTDVSNGQLRQITWITPTAANSDHLGSNSTTGPMWVASVVNAIGQSKFWDSTAIFIFWDDPGGFYDPVPPPYVNYDGLGMRLPLLVVSPYAKKGYISHVQYEHGSMLKFVEDVFGLPRLSASDTRANSPAGDAFDFSKPPRKFVAIPSALGKQYFIHQPLDRRPVDTY